MNFATEPFEVVSDGVTVWLNIASGCIARFGQKGIDIHRPLEQQCIEGECLFCTHENTTAEDWPTFVAKCKEHFGIDVPEEHMPDRFRST